MRLLQLLTLALLAGPAFCDSIPVYNYFYPCDPSGCSAYGYAGVPTESSVPVPPTAMTLSELGGKEPDGFVGRFIPNFSNDQGESIGLFTIDTGTGAPAMEYDGQVYLPLGFNDDSNRPVGLNDQGIGLWQSARDLIIPYSIGRAWA